MTTIPAEAVIVHRGRVLRKLWPSVWRPLQNGWRRVTTSVVVPVGPTILDLPPSSKITRAFTARLSVIHRQSVVAIASKYLSFKDAFGNLGPPMVVVALICISWTMWLILLTIAPNQTANYLMDTGDYDDGQFWLISEKLTTLQLFSVLGLLIVLVMYVFVLLKMLVWRKQSHVEGTLLDRILQHCAPDQVEGAAELAFSHRVRYLIWELYIILKELTGFHGKYRKLWNLCLKAFDLAMQSFVLCGLLEAGAPLELTLGFASFVALNSASCATAIISGKHSAFTEILVDSLFDLGGTVLFPILVLTYCAHTFEYDHAVFLIYTELMPVGSFERRARMFADPMEIELFRVAFDSLRIRSVAELFLRIGMNLGFSYRFKRVVEVLIQMQTQQQTRRKPVTMLAPTILISTKAHGCQRSVPRSIAIIFIAYSVGILVGTHKAIATSQDICSSHPACVVYAYRWSDSELCPCRALVDGNRAPKTYYEWTHPVDATDTVKALAAAGTLETFQLINRYLITLPEELRGCRQLHFLSIINCAIEELPVWANEFHQLEYLQIEGKVGSNNLGELPADLFSNMPELRYLQLGLHQTMMHLPPLDGAPNLCCINLSRMGGIRELPSLERLSQLGRMEFAVMKHLSMIPDLEPIGPVVHFAIYQDAHICCNGFFDTCDLTNPFCKDASCLEESSPRATSATLQVFEKFAANVCQAYTGVSQTPTAQTIQMCDGVPFRQCELPGLDATTTVIGMCYNHRMQVLACNPDPAEIRVRIRQIQDGVGLPCHPVVEAWLGCGTGNAVEV